MRPQKAITQPVKRAHPHPAGVNRQLHADAREHFLSRFIGKRHRQQPAWAGLPRLNQPRNAGGQHTRFAATRARQHQGGTVSGGGRGGVLFGV